MCKRAQACQILRRKPVTFHEEASWLGTVDSHNFSYVLEAARKRIILGAIYWSYAWRYLFLWMGQKRHYGNYGPIPRKRNDRKQRRASEWMDRATRSIEQVSRCFQTRVVAEKCLLKVLLSSMHAVLWLGYSLHKYGSYGWQSESQRCERDMWNN